MAYQLEERKCAHCGKIFVPAVYHSYSVADENGHSLFCCYTHKLRYIEQRDEQRRRKKEEMGKRTDNE